MLKIFWEYIKIVWSSHWYLIGGIVGGVMSYLALFNIAPDFSLPTSLAILFVGLSIAQFIAFRKVRSERDEALRKLVGLSEKTVSESELKLREMRLRVRNTKVSEIPDILIHLRNELESIATKRKVSKSDPQIILSVYLKTLGITKDDPIFKIKLYDNKKMFEALKNRTGIKTPNSKKLQEYRLRLSENINSYKVGVENFLTEYFNNEKRKLDGIVTSDKLLNNAMDNYIQQIISLNNLRVFWNYMQNIDNPQVKNFFDTPDNRNLRHKLEDRINKDIKESLTHVLRLLEKYQTGEPLNEDEGEL